MVDIAEAIISQMEKPFNPAEYRDTYTESLRQTIEARIEGKEVTGPAPAPAMNDVVSLMDVLKQSLQEAREKKKFSEAVGEEKPTRKPRKKAG